MIKVENGRVGVLYHHLVRVHNIQPQGLKKPAAAVADKPKPSEDEVSVVSTPPQPPPKRDDAKLKLFYTRSDKETFNCNKCRSKVSSSGNSSWV